MKELGVKIDGGVVIVSYEPLWPRCVEIKFIDPFGGLKVEKLTPNEESNFFDPVEAEVYVKESVRLLVKQIRHVIEYRTVYQTITDDYKHITDIMFAALKAADMNSRDKFKYHFELQDRVREEMFNQIRLKISSINESNEEEYLIWPPTISKILSVI